MMDQKHLVANYYELDIVCSFVIFFPPLSFDSSLEQSIYLVANIPLVMKLYNYLQ